MQNKTPQFLYEILLNEYGQNITEKIINGYLCERPTTFRVNTSKTSTDYIEQKLRELEINFKQVPWNNTAFIIENAKENEIKELDIYKNGEIYLQSLSSMIPPIVVDPKEGENILDMAAAPGGKTTQMASLSNNKSMITACEKNKIRAERLKYNLEKQGTSRVSVMLKDAKKLISFIQGIQAASPIDSFVLPEPWDMPGYNDPVIMAAGTFVSGASIELSCDAPVKEPYAVFMQGGLTYESAKLGVCTAIDKMLKGN